MPPQVFIQPETSTRVICHRVLVKGRFEIHRALRNLRVENEVQGAALPNSLCPSKEEAFFFPNGTTEIIRRIPAVQKRRARRGPRYVVRIEHAIAEEN